MVPRRDLGPSWLEAEARGDVRSGPATSRSCHTARATLCERARRPAPGILELEREQVSDRYEILRHGGGGAPTTLICGAVRFDHPAARHLVALAAGDDLRRGVELAAAGLDAEHAAADGRRGEGAAARRRDGHHPPGDILVIQAIRSWIETDPAAQTGWLGALQDRQIGRAISLIHREPARAWTVASLAREVAMSRSAFAARFTELVGEPAMQYVDPLADAPRARRAPRGRRTVGELASRLGYRSEAAFSRAFKRVVGVPPGAVRRSAV